MSRDEKGFINKDRKKHYDSNVAMDVANDVPGVLSEELQHSSRESVQGVQITAQLAIAEVYCRPIYDSSARLGERDFCVHI